MAQEELTGMTQRGLAELKEEYQATPMGKSGVPFETAYCLTRIGKQPDEYDGPQRYCTKWSKKLGDVDERAPSCRFHGGTNHNSVSNKNLDPTAPIKHGMYATDEHLEEVFTEQDQKLYDWVMSWADAYGWPDRDEDPSRYDDLEAIAINRVRVARSHKYILDEGEMDRDEVYDENGNLRTLTDPHGLSEDTRLKRKLITDLKKELGITPKEQARQDTQETKASAAEQVADLATEAVFGNEEQGYDPDDDVFEED